MGSRNDEQDDAEDLDSVLQFIARAESIPIPGGLVGDRFRILEIAGRGGFGTVFHAHDEAMDTDVALKVLREGCTDIARFEREAELLATIRHPNVVSYVAHGLTEEGAPYLAMEWLRGADLAHRLKAGPLSIHEALTVVVRSAQGLAAAHTRGILHRDVKPSNLYLVDESVDDVRVIDFGVARVLAPESVLTSTGALIGTPSYMAPEQARGARDLSPRADVFSLGCVLFECVAGGPPFAGSNPHALFARLLEGRAPRLSDRRHGAPPMLDALLARMLAHDPIDRFSDAAAVAIAVAAVLSDGARTPPAFAGPIVTARSARVQSTLLARAGRGRKITAGLRGVPPALGGEILFEDDALLVFAFSADSPAETARRAVRCAFALREEEGSLRIAVATARRDTVVAAPFAVKDQVGISLEDAADGDVLIDAPTANHLAGEYKLERRGPAIAVVGRRGPTPESVAGLVGRAREIALLEGVSREVIDERCARCALIVGDAGIGKSRLLGEMLRRVRRDQPAAAVLREYGDRPVSTTPFAITAQLLRSSSGDGASGDARHEPSVPHGLSAVDADFLRELAGYPATPDENVLLRSARRDPMLMADAFRSAWLAFVDGLLESGPLLLFVEDVHHADLASTRLIDAALEQFAERPLLFVGTARPDEEGDALTILGAREPERIVLKPLRPSIAAELVRAIANKAPDERVSSIVERGAGNPLRLLELARLGDVGVTPDSAASAVEARLARLDSFPQRVLRAASVFGMHFGRRGLSTLLGDDTPAGEIDRALLLAEEERFIGRDGAARDEADAEWSFRHGLVQEVAYARLANEEQRAAHAAVARWLARQPGANASLIAWHFERAEARDDALHWYEAAARAALRGREIERVFSLTDNAMACDPRGEVLARVALVRAEAAFLKGDPLAGKRSATAALEAARAGSSTWTTAAGILITSAGQRGDNADVAGLAEMVRAQAPDKDAAAEWAIGLCRAATQLFTAGERAASQTLIEAAEPAIGDDPLARAWQKRWLAGRSVVDHDYDAAIAHQGEAVRLHTAVGDVRNASLCRVLLASMHIFAVDFERAEEELEIAAPMARRTGADYYVRWASYARGKLLALAHEPSLARSHLDRVRRELAGNPRIVAGTHIYAALAAFRAGDLAWAEAEARAAFAAHDAPATRAVALAALARSLALQGSGADALRSADEALATLATLGAIEENEALVHLAVIEAGLASGLEERACQAARSALDRLTAIAQKLSSPTRQERYLHGHPVHAETLRLAAKLGLSADLP